MYDKHGIVKGGHGATISLILDERIRVVWELMPNEEVE